VIDGQTWLNLGLVVLFVLIGGVFAATELALVSLRDSQLNALERAGGRGARVASIARDPNRFLSAVQIGVTVAGFFSAAYGGSTLAPDVAPYLERLGLSAEVASGLAIAVLTLLIAYLSLVLGELAPKRLALQRAVSVATLTGPPLDRFATVMRPVIWLLSRSSDGIVRLLGGDPDLTGEEVTKEELREIVSSHESLGDDERRILSDVFAATRSNLKEVMRPRADVTFIAGAMTLADARTWLADQPYSRFPVIGDDFDDVTGFVHVRDILQAGDPTGRTVADVQRDVLHLPGTNRVLPTVSAMREEGAHLAIVIDEFGGTDGLVTLEDLVEELIGEITDEFDLEGGHAAQSPEDGWPRVVPGGVTLEELAEQTGVELPDGDYETAAGYLMARLGRMPVEGDAVSVGEHVLTVTAIEGRRITQVELSPTPVSPDQSPSDAEWQTASTLLPSGSRTKAP